MGRHSGCYKQTLRKGLWSPDEDEKLIRHIAKHGHGCWSSVPEQAGLQRCGKSCRLRWINYLRPDLKRGTFSLEEEELIIELQAALGNRWSKIAAHLPGRTDNEIKNLWNSCLKKKLRQRGNDPNFHKSPVEGDGGDEKSGAGSGDLQIPSIPTSASAKLAALHELTPSAEDESMTLTSKSSLEPTKEAILDQFLAGHDSMGYYFPFNLAPQYAMSSSQLLWSNQDSRNFDMNHELNSPPSHSSTILSTPMAPSPSFLGAGTAAILNSYSNNTNKSYGGCELSGFFPWSELTPEEDTLVQLGGEIDELKWSEYLHGVFPLSSTVQDQSQPPPYGDIKLGSQLAMNCLNDWHWNSQQQQQRSVIHGEDFLPVSLGYEQS